MISQMKVEGEENRSLTLQERVIKFYQARYIVTSSPPCHKLWGYVSRIEKSPLKLALFT
jgi:hypothetical protein